MRYTRTLAVAALLFAQLIAAVNIIYDETGWTKQEWSKYKLEYNSNFEPSPIDEVIKSPEIRNALSKSSINSINGPLPRTAVSRPVGLWSSEDGSLVETLDEESLDAAAEAVTCTVCHSVVSHVWQQVVSAVHSSEAINEDSVGDMIDDACEQTHVPLKVLSSYRIVKVDAPEAGVTMFVVRARPHSSSSSGSSSSSSVSAKVPPGTDAEVTATVKACKDMSSHHKALLLKPLWKSANDYFINYRNIARRMQSKIKIDSEDTDEYDDVPDDEEDAALQRKAMQHIPEHKLLPYDAVCMDLELLCPLWAAMGECMANPKYMMGTARKVGHCRASCNMCTPDPSWRAHPIAAKELSASASTILNSLRQSICTASQACLPGSSSSSSIPATGKKAVVKNANVLPGAALAQMDGFVLGKPFWGIPTVEAAAGTGNTKAAAAAAGKPSAAAVDPAEQLLDAEGTYNKFITIIGMDGFFLYQVHYKTRIYQYHQEMKGSKLSVTEDHVLGVYDPAATKAAYKKDKMAAVTDAAKAWLQQQQQETSDSMSSNSGDQASKETEEDGDAAAAAAAGAEAAANSKGKAAAAAAAGSDVLPPPPMLDLLDYLPDTAHMITSWWPYYRQMYTGGEHCAGEGGGKPRKVELRVACSPHTDSWRMLVREPEFCSYIVVLYHPGLCSLPRYKPVSKAAAKTKAQKASAASSSSSKSDKKGSRSSSSKKSSSSNQKEDESKLAAS